MQNRCGIFIDIEGTSNLYIKDELFFYNAIDTLLTTALNICYTYIPQENNRLFLHQMGADGIFLISERMYKEVEIPISIAIVIMQNMLLQGVVCKGGISKGDNADIQSCHPTLQDLLSTDPPNPASGGLMSRLNIMGTALINSYKFASIKPSGGRLAVDRSIMTVTPQNIIISQSMNEMSIIDWVHSYTVKMKAIYESIATTPPEKDNLKKILTQYVKETGDSAKKDWGENTLKFNGCKKR